MFEIKSGLEIYMAGPIGNGHTVDPRTMYHNVRQAEEVMLQLMKKNWAVICPHLSYYPYLHWDDHIDWKKWMLQDYVFLTKADAFFYMTPEKYGPSKGAAQELEWANSLDNIKAVFTNLDKVPTLPEVQIEL